jgi:hypothetical protein
MHKILAPVLLGGAEVRLLRRKATVGYSELATDGVTHLAKPVSNRRGVGGL